MAQYPNASSEIPTGLGMALMQNKQASDYFYSLSDEVRQRVIDGTHAIQSKEEMQSYVDSLAKNSLP